MTVVRIPVKSSAKRTDTGLHFIILLYIMLLANISTGGQYQCLIQQTSYTALPMRLLPVAVYFQDLDWSPQPVGEAFLWAALSTIYVILDGL